MFSEDSLWTLAPLDSPRADSIESRWRMFIGISWPMVHSRMLNFLHQPRKRKHCMVEAVWFPQTVWFKASYLSTGNSWGSNQLDVSLFLTFWPNYVFQHVSLWFRIGHIPLATDCCHLLFVTDVTVSARPLGFYRQIATCGWWSAAFSAGLPAVRLKVWPSQLSQLHQLNGGSWESSWSNYIGPWQMLKSFCEASEYTEIDS